MKNKSSDLNFIVENTVYVLVQSDGRQPNDSLVVINVEALMGISCLTSRLLWSPGMFY